MVPVIKNKNSCQKIWIVGKLLLYCGFSWSNNRDKLKFIAGKGGYNFVIETDDLYDYFNRFIILAQAIMPEDKFLTPKERAFLVHCCVFNAEGGDLTDKEQLYEHFVDNLRFFKDIQGVKNYKWKLGAKTWAETGYGVFKLPPDLASVPKEDYTVKLDFQEEKETTE